MKNGPIPRKTRAPRKLKRPPAPGAWSLLVIDSGPIRQRAHREYDRVVRDVEKAKGEIERFRAEDQPRYTKWLNSTFGGLLTENRQFQERLYELQGIVSEVQQEFYYGDHYSIASAYAKVMRRRTHPEEFENERKEAEAEEQAFRESFEEKFREAEKVFECAGFDVNDFEQEETGTKKFKENGPAGSQVSRVKDLYRSLARKLHPDAGGERSRKQVEWWHQTQRAYEAGDVEQMELILTLAEIEERGTKDATVSILQQITAQFRIGLNALRRELRRHRRDPAWNFSQADDLEVVQERVRGALRFETENLRLQVQAFEKQIEAWEALARKTPPPRRMRPRAQKERGLEFF